MANTETIVDSTSIGSGGGTATGTFGMDTDSDVAVVVIRGDSNTTDLDVAASGGAVDASGTTLSLNGGSSVTGIDASSGDTAVRLTGLSGLGKVQVTVTNQAGSATTVTVEEHSP